ncbi:MAG: hypothetical protein U5N85_07410 [Arcicella sp.]|nr:hypothetical protein [Arcicella sp.]
MGQGGSLNPAGNTTTFYALPNPSGVNATTFKYVKVWASENRTGLYLKGNDGNIYYAGSANQNYNSTGAPNLFYYTDGIGNIFNNNGTAGNPTSYNFMTDAPALVPFPAGEDIVRIDSRIVTNTLAISASGKAYATGIWKQSVATNGMFNFYRFPLKNTPVLGTELFKNPLPATGVPLDTTYFLKKFVEVATPTGATKITEFASISPRDKYPNFVIVGDNKQAYWSGTTNEGIGFYNKVDYLDYSILCTNNRYSTTSANAWSVPAPELHNASKIFAGYAGMYIISGSKIGYVVGTFQLGTDAFGRTTDNGNVQNLNRYLLPTPVGNEKLDFCNAVTSSGWAVAVTTPGVGSIDCNKTQLIPAPVFGTASQTDLVITINGNHRVPFPSPTVSGSGMTLVSETTPLLGRPQRQASKHFMFPYITMAQQHWEHSRSRCLPSHTSGGGGCAADLSKSPKMPLPQSGLWNVLPTVGIGA